MSDASSDRVDRFGRLLSDDGRWYWDGLEWQQHFAPPPLPFAAPTSPTPESAEFAAPADPGPTTGPDPRTDATPPASGPSAATAWPTTPEPGLPPPPAVEPPTGPVLHRSPDGRWGWTGDRWVPVGPSVEPGIRPGPSPQPTVLSPPSHGATPDPVTPPHMMTAPVPQVVFDPRGEAKRYPTMWRPAGRALRDVPGLLEPGEVVLATAPGEGDMVELRQLQSLTIVTGYTFDPAYLLVATDRRVLALGLSASASKVQRVHVFPYAAITHWSARMSRAATLVTRTGFIALAAEPDEAAGMKRIPGQLFDEVRAQIEPRLDPALLRGDTR